MSRRSRIVLLASAAMAAIYCASSFAPKNVWFVDSQANYYRSFWREHSKILERESLTEYLTFDEPSSPEYADEATDLECDSLDYVSPRVVKATGRHGKGIKFDGENDTFYAMDCAWNRIPNAFSIAFWMKLDAMPISQDIFCIWSPKQVGFKLDRGYLRFDWASTKSANSLSYEFSKYGEFVHVAIIADQKTGTIRLYENGQCMATGDCSDLKSFRWQFTIGKGNFARSRYPLHGTIDDLAIWHRAISEDELRDIVTSPLGLHDYFSTAKSRMTIGKKRIRANIMKRIGGYLPDCSVNLAQRLQAASAMRDMGRIHIYVRDPNMRKLARIHAKSRRTGVLTSHDMVEAFVTIDGKTQECNISLAGGTMYYPYTDRPGYVIEPLDRSAAFSNGQRRIELLPPEKSGWIAPIVTSEIRKQCDLGNALRKDCDAVRLEINGMKRGIYLMRDASRSWLSLDDTTDVLDYNSSVQPFVQRDAEKARFSSSTIDGATSSLLSLLSVQDRNNIERKLTRISECIVADCHSPVPASFRTEVVRDQMASYLNAFEENTLPRIDDIDVSPLMFLGSNLCAWCITDDLDITRFKALLPAEYAVTFESSNTNLISSAGKVTRPTTRPELVTLTATLSTKGGASRSVPLEYRVLPTSNAVPAVFVWSPVPFGRTHRTDAALEIIDFSGTNGPTWHFDGYAAIRYRGNSSFRYNKKLISIKTDVPHHWFGDTETTHLLTINAMTDVMRVWNRLAYDLFRDFPRHDGVTNIAPHVKTAELFVNGRYWSLIEFAERLDEYLWGNPDHVAFRHRIASPRNPFMRQSRPDISRLDALDIYLDFEKQLSSFDGKESLEQIKAQLDMTSVIDYMILFSLFANVNGGDNNFWTQECLMYDPVAQKFHYIPWDFDVLMQRDPGIQETKLNRLLATADPTYDKMVLERWRELRKTVLATDAVLARYDEIAAQHAEYLPFEYMTWYPEHKDWINIQPIIRGGRERMAYRLEKMDRLFTERCEKVDDSTR